MFEGARRKGGMMLAALAALLAMFVLIGAPATHADPSSPAEHAAGACADLTGSADCGLHADASRIGLHAAHGVGCHMASGACAAVLLPSHAFLPARAAREAQASLGPATFWSDRVRDPMLRPPIPRA